LKLVNEFEVAAPLAAAWPVLTDIPRVARCLPGATVESSEGDTHRGRMTVKIGPITATYGGSAIVQETDEDSHTVVMALEARETRGQGMASATITNRLEPHGDRTKVTVETELRMTGAHAQFGRGILQSVAGSMVKQFAANLEAEIHGGGGQAATATPPAGAAWTTPGTGEPVRATAAAPAMDVTSLLPGLITPKVALSALGLVGLLLMLRRRPARSGEIHIYLHLPGEPR
jgi:uncharacterized protein